MRSAIRKFRHRSGNRPPELSLEAQRDFSPVKNFFFLKKEIMAGNRKRTVTMSQHAKILAALAVGATNDEAAKVAGVSRQVADDMSAVARKKLIPETQKIIEKDIKEAVREGLQGLSFKLLGIANMAADSLTKEKISVQSGAAIATTLAICIDKMQLLTGGPTASVHMRFPDRAAMLAYVKGTGPVVDVTPEKD